jgi:2-desacetyl-2-hydroxyethyl bacteriochlorophyllide A dehydrogenase
MNEWDIKVELEASAISVGTERWALMGKRPKGDVTFPCIPGYLSVGKIVDKGSEVKGYDIGQRVNFVAARIPDGYTGNWMCGHISPALVNVNPENIDPLWDLPYCEIVPEAVSAEVATFAGLAGVACRGIEMAGLKLGDNVVVVGQGFIGQMAAQICRLKGARVIAADILPGRVELSAKYSADFAVNSKEENLTEFVHSLYPDGADVVIDTTGSDRMINEEISFLRMWGKLIFQGWYPGNSSLFLHNFQNNFVTAYFPSGHAGMAVRQVLQWMDDSKLVVEPLITHRFLVKDAIEAYDLVLNKPEEILGVLFTWE